MPILSNTVVQCNSVQYFLNHVNIAGVFRRTVVELRTDFHASDHEGSWIVNNICPRSELNWTERIAGLALVERSDEIKHSKHHYLVLGWIRGRLFSYAAFNYYSCPHKILNILPAVLYISKDSLKFKNVKQIITIFEFIGSILPNCTNNTKHYKILKCNSYFWLVKMLTCIFGCDLLNIKIIIFILK